EQVDQLLPMADLLLWVVDPQKYADHALHGRYLAQLTGRRSAMLVLVNQVDTLPVEAVDPICRDMARLLAADGLPDVPVLATSAKDLTGIPEVREHLRHAVASPAAALDTARAELAHLAQELSSYLAAGSEPAVPAVEE